MFFPCVYHQFFPETSEEIHARGVLDEASAADALRHVANVMLNDLESRLLSDARCFKTAVGEDWDGWLGWLGYPLVNSQFANWKMTIEIVDVPINSMVIFHSYVSLPEG